MEPKELKPDGQARFPQENEHAIKKGKQATSKEDQNPRGEKNSPRKSSLEQKESTLQSNPRRVTIPSLNIIQENEYGIEQGKQATSKEDQNPEGKKNSPQKSSSEQKEFTSLSIPRRVTTPSPNTAQQSRNAHPKNRDIKSAQTAGRQDQKATTSDNSPRKHPSERRDKKRIQTRGKRNQRVATSDYGPSKMRSRERKSSGGEKRNQKVAASNQGPSESERKLHGDRRHSQIIPTLDHHSNEREMRGRNTNQFDDDPKRETSGEVKSARKHRKEISFFDNVPQPHDSNILRPPIKRRDRTVSFSGKLPSSRDKSESEVDITHRPNDARRLSSDLRTINNREPSSSETPRPPSGKRDTVPSIVFRPAKESATRTEQRTSKQRLRQNSVHPERTKKSTEDLPKKEQRPAPPFYQESLHSVPSKSMENVSSRRLKRRVQEGKPSKSGSWFSEVNFVEDTDLLEKSSSEMIPDKSNQKFLMYQRRISDKDWSMELLQETDYDPHEFRAGEYQTSNAEALLLMIKVCLGTGVFTMPEAYKYAGLFYGMVSTFWVITFMSYGISTLVKCQYLLCKRLKIPSINYPDTLVAALTIGPKNLRRYARNSGYFLAFLILLNRFCNCTVYIIFVAKHMKAIIDLHTTKKLALEVYMVVLTVPLSVISSVRGIKFLAPIAMAANVCMLVSIGVTLTYMVTSLPDLHEKQGVGTIWDLPLALSTIMFAFDSVTSIIVIERTMKEPKSFAGFFGVFSINVLLLSVSFTCVGFFGYWKFGDAVRSLITMNLPANEGICQLIMVLSASGVWVSYSLQVFVPVFYLSGHMKNWPNSFAWEYLLRVCWVIFPLIFAASVPELKLIIPFFGSLCGPLLQFGFPALIEFCLKYSDTMTYGRWIAVVDICIIIYALTGIVTGLHSTITIIYLGRFT